MSSRSHSTARFFELVQEDGFSVETGTGAESGRNTGVVLGVAAEVRTAEVVRLEGFLVVKNYLPPPKNM